MVNLYKQDGEILYGVKEYIIDSMDDVKDLPTNVRPGSIAMLVPSGVKYILNGRIPSGKNTQWDMNKSNAMLISFVSL